MSKPLEHQRKRPKSGKNTLNEELKEFRFSRIFSIAVKVLENEDAAKNWLHRPQVGLGGKVPVDLLKTEAGAREVEELLLRIEYGLLG